MILGSTSILNIKLSPKGIYLLNPPAKYVKLVMLKVIQSIINLSDQVKTLTLLKVI